MDEQNVPLCHLLTRAHALKHTFMRGCDGVVVVLVGGGGGELAGGGEEGESWLSRSASSILSIRPAKRPGRMNHL